MPAWLNILGVAIVFVGFLGASVIFLRGSKDKGTIDTLERSNHALNGRVDVLEKENGELKTRVSHLERDNVALAAQRPSAEVLTDIRQMLVTYVADAKQTNAEVKALLMAIARIIEPKDQS